MFNRACRILTSPADDHLPHAHGLTPTSAVGTARLSPSERWSRWKVLLLKVSLLFDTLQQQNKAKLLLGEAVYKSLFHSKHVSIADQPPMKFRFVKGQAVGKALAPGVGSKDAKKAHVDPAMCSHPDESMLPRGNLQDKWWTCQKCQSRWQRLPSNEVTPMTGAGSHLDLITFGKHTGDTYQQLMTNDRKYCQWVCQTAEEGEASTQLQRLAGYIQAQLMEESYEADGFFHAEMDQDDL